MRTPERIPSPARHAYLDRVALPFALPTGVYGAMLVIWHLRPWLQTRFPLHRGQVRDYVRYLAWCVAEGRTLYLILRAIPEWDAELNQPIALPELPGDPWRDGFSVGMFLYGVAHSHYTFRAVLEQVSVRNKVATAYWRGERHARSAPAPIFWQRDFLRRKFGTFEALIEAMRVGRHDAGKTKDRLIAKLHLDDLAAQWAMEGQPPADSGPVRHAKTVPLPHGLKRSPVRVPVSLLRPASVVEWINARPTEAQLAAVTKLVPVSPKRKPAIAHPFGVNLFGYARGELGIGEDVRLVAAALQTQGIPFCIVNVQPGKEISQKDTSVEGWIRDEPRYGINIFCITGVEQGRLACEKGFGLQPGYYNIGLSPWELPKWPASCCYAYGMVDEIWGISSYTARAYQDGPCRVKAMTLPVTIGPIAEQGRADFGLPEKAYLFVFAFDLHSTVARKNPEGVVRAFQKAFRHETSDEVGLVLKVNTPAADMDSLNILERVALFASKYRAWQAVKRLADADPRIHIIERSMRRPQLMALYRACDCFVSLHRAEGFGRCLAEALRLDLQLIVTGFSGNLDFCTEPRVGLVRHRLRPLRPNEYFWSDGQMWAEPSVEHAAELMRDIRKNPRDTRSYDFDFSPAAAGRRYAERLHEIQEEYHLKEALVPENIGGVASAP